MDKRKLIDVLKQYLTEEKNTAEPARADEIERLLVMYRFLPSRDHGPEEVIVPSSLVELKLGAMTTFCFVAPQGGGLVTNVDGKAVQVVTPNSPLGEALLGRKRGDVIKVDIRGAVREYEVLKVS